MELPETFQVFINHRGPDVKKTLASLIYHRLTKCGLSVFLDRDEIGTGDNFTHAITTAIQHASLHIAIFSERYAESKWCLDELLWILRSYHKRNTKVIPVFFDVEPRELRDIESGHYAKAFEAHQKQQLNGSVTIADIQNWKGALNDASHLSGLQFKTGESDLGELPEKIVKIVAQEIPQAEPREITQAEPREIHQEIPVVRCLIGMKFAVFVGVLRPKWRISCMKLSKFLRR